MGRLGKETKIMLMGITVVCLLSFALAAGTAVLLANNFQQEMLIHDSGIAGYLLNHGDELEVAAFTATPDESDFESGRAALASVGYDETVSTELLPVVRTYRNQAMLYLFLLLLFLFGTVYFILCFYLWRQHRAINEIGRAHV